MNVLTMQSPSLDPNGLVVFVCLFICFKESFLCFCGRFSKHPFIADSSVVTALPDGTPSSMNFADNRNNRFK